VGEEGHKGRAAQPGRNGKKTALKLGKEKKTSACVVLWEIEITAKQKGTALGNHLKKSMKGGASKHC